MSGKRLESRTPPDALHVLLCVQHTHSFKAPVFQSLFWISLKIYPFKALTHHSPFQSPSFGLL